MIMYLKNLKLFVGNGYQIPPTQLRLPEWPPSYPLLVFLSDGRVGGPKPGFFQYILAHSIATVQLNSE